MSGPGPAEFESAGLYDRSAPGAPERLELLEYLASRGVSLEAMAGADGPQELGTLAAASVLRIPGAPLDVGSVAARSSTSVDHVLGVRMASGLPLEAGEALPPTVVDDMRSFEAGATLFGEGPTLAFTRVMGGAMAKVADAAVSLFITERAPRPDGGATALERARDAEQASSTFMSVVPNVIVNLLREHMARAVLRATSERNPDDARAVTLGIGFVDLVGSTSWSSMLSLEEHANALTRFESAAWDFATLNHGRVVKLIGDEVMFVAPTGLDVTHIARELCRFAERERTLPEARGAAGYGPVGSRDGDYFGPLVNLVARALHLADPSSVVVTAEVGSELLASAHPGEDWIVAELPPQALRGFDNSVELYFVR